MTMQATEEALATLLGDAGTAHGAYETTKLGGVYDQQWTAWYARYLMEHGIGALLGRSITVEEVAALLTACDEAYKRENPAMSWPDFYARQLLGTRG